MTEDGYTIEGTWLDVVAADVRLDVSVFDGMRACRGRSALGGGSGSRGSRDGVDGRVRDGVAVRSGTADGAGLEKSGESARGGLRVRLTRDDERAEGVEGG